VRCRSLGVILGGGAVVVLTLFRNGTPNPVLSSRGCSAPEVDRAIEKLELRGEVPPEEMRFEATKERYLFQAAFTASFSRDSAQVRVEGPDSAYPLEVSSVSSDFHPAELGAGTIRYRHREAALSALYRPTSSGVKEDIVVLSPETDLAPLLQWRLALKPGSEPRLESDGSIGIYGPHETLSGNIKIGDEKTAYLIAKAREHSPKSRLLYRFPAPVLVDAAGTKHANLARYELWRDCLVVRTEEAIRDLEYPISIDPTIVVSTTSEFNSIGNLEGMVSTAGDRVTRSPASTGRVGTWVGTTAFTTGRYGHTSVAHNGFLYVIGGYNNGTYLDNVQVAPINSNGTLGGWVVTTSLPMTIWGHTSVAWNGYLYVIGGYDGSMRRAEVQVAPINSDGTLGTWSTTTALGTARYRHTSVAYNGYLYVLGGDSGSNLNDVQVAAINADGTLGGWSATASFATVRWGHTSAAYNGYLYVIGGYDGSTYRYDVQSAPINANGTVGTWSGTTGFTTGRRAFSSVANNGFLYVIGGYQGSSPLADVQVAPINAGGAVGAWTPTTSFPSPRYSHSSVAHNGYLYVIGGFDGGYRNDIQVAPINSNGTVGSWTSTQAFTTAREGHRSVVHNGFLYVVGGSPATSSYLNDVQYSLIGVHGTVGSWSSMNSFTGTRFRHTSVAYNSYLYVIGGSDGTAKADVQVARLNEDGTVGSWSTTTALGTARYGHTSVAEKGKLYVIGGTGMSDLNDVQVAPINSDGTLGGWSSTTGFSTARYGHASAVYNGYLYVIGGFGSAYLDDVQVARINSDGSLGPWSTTTAFTTARVGHKSVVYNGYLYVIGGENGSNLGDVQFAALNADGTVGTWSTTMGYPMTSYGHAVVAQDGYLYLLGGNNSASQKDVKVAPINSEGALGCWTSINAFSSARYGHGAVSYNGFLYVVGGYDGTSYFNDVQSTTLWTPAARGYYSRQIDLGSDQPVNTILINGTSGLRGTVRLQYRLAPSGTAQYGSEGVVDPVTLGTSVSAGDVTARYVWLRVLLDDTSSAAVNPDASNVRDVTDVQVGYGVVPSPDPIPAPTGTRNSEKTFHLGRCGLLGMEALFLLGFLWIRRRS